MCPGANSANSLNLKHDDAPAPFFLRVAYDVQSLSGAAAAREHTVRASMRGGC